MYYNATRKRLSHGYRQPAQKNSVKFTCVVAEIYMETQTHRQTDKLITILCSLTGGTQ